MVWELLLTCFSEQIQSHSQDYYYYDFTKTTRVLDVPVRPATPPLYSPGL